MNEGEKQRILNALDYWRLMELLEQGDFPAEANSDWKDKENKINRRQLCF